MRLRARYAVSFVAVLALASGDRMTLTAAAKLIHCSASYLEQLAALLRRAGIVSAMRGSDGGYTLARPAHCISVADVLIAVDGDMVGNSTASALGGIWHRVVLEMMGHLGGISVAELIAFHEREAA